MNKSENIKQYYQKLVASYRSLSHQLSIPNLTQTQRHHIQTQLDKVQHALQAFTERIIKPMISKRKAAKKGPTLIADEEDWGRRVELEGSVGDVVGKLLHDGAIPENNGNYSASNKQNNTNTSKLVHQIEQSIDTYLRQTCKSLALLASHRQRPGISLQDTELLLGRILGLPQAVAGLPFAVSPKLPVATFNRHLCMQGGSSKKSFASAGAGGLHQQRVMALRRHLYRERTKKETKQ